MADGMATAERAIALALLLHVAHPALAETVTVRTGERLSDWLLRQGDVPAAYSIGIGWRVPAQVLPQARLKNHLLARLAVSPEIESEPAARERMRQWLESLPVTGRAPVPMADARWLQAHPERDPLLEDGHTVHLPGRPGSVTVVTDSARRCALPHRPGAQTLAYLRACQSEAAERADHAWIVQPDGRVRRYGIAAWNREAQDEPAPGAWLWAPARDAGWPESFSTAFASFLATQGPAPDDALQPDTAPPRPEARARDAVVSASDWGEIGLLQTPTARMAPEGELRFNFSRVYPYGRGNVFLQPLDWLEAGFRYTNISNRLYGPANLSGDQAYKDKSIDAKVRLLRETATTPELAAGVVDMGGTGLFSSEYLVANKRTGDFDWSLGLAWGNLGGRGNLRNPLSVFSRSFDTRPPPNVGSGGTVNTSSFFRGRAALFGGVQYQTPWDGLLLKAEYDGNDYRNEPQGNNQKQGSPINLGLNWSYSPNIDIAAGIERGNTLMLGFTFRGALDKLSMPKLLDPPMPAIVAAKPAGEPDWAKTAADLKTQTLWPVREIRRQGGDLHVVFDRPAAVYWNERIERAAAVLHRDAPATVQRFVLTYQERGMKMTEHVVLRDAWVARHTLWLAPVDRTDSHVAVAPRPGAAGAELWGHQPDRIRGGIAPNYQQSLGGPDGFILFQAGVAAAGELRFSDTTWLSGRLNLRLLDNYDKFRYTAPSNLPRVRTYLREYLTTEKVTLPNLQLTHAGRLGENQFYSVYGGYLESMFAGFGAEWLYRPWHGPVALGVDINRVRQRNFEQDFGLRDYRVTTGHATLYLDTGWKNIQAGISAGQYLAGDRGITLSILRSFSNGVSMGAYATKTNVSSATFGEGSFDKGIYVNIPMDALLPRSSPSMANITWSPLTRDGGARLGRSYSLHALTSSRDRQLPGYGPPSREKAGPVGDSTWSFWSDLGNSARGLGRQLASPQAGSALLWGGGIVLASAALDRSADRWAQRHDSGNWKAIGTAANGIPYLLAAGSGLFLVGLGGDAAKETAWTSIKAAGYTLATEVLTKSLVGRARPEENLGPTHFSGSGAAKSSFPSIHMGTAFALVTPFAEQYDAPWLYALAGATAYGRIQQRQHFVSDAVAGSLIGYAIGSLLLEQQRVSRRGPRFGIGPDRSITAAWDF